MALKILVTCPPMLGMIEELHPLFAQRGAEAYCPDVVQTMNEQQLIDLVPQFDGWIIGDDPATFAVFKAGRAGSLKAAVKWGAGVDNVDFAACEHLGIPITNTPGTFGAEVADIAIGYVVALARDTFIIDRGVRNGEWPKPRGISLAGKTVGIIGFGNIGSNAAKRLLAADMQVIVYDPALQPSHKDEPITVARWPDRLYDADFLVITCSLTQSSHHMVDAEILALAKKGLRIVNVARGPVLDELALATALEAGHVHSAALDVFETEPLPLHSRLRRQPRCIFGSHNASNTTEAVQRTSKLAVDKLFEFLAIR